MVNHHLLRDLTEAGLWSEDMKNEMISQNGSIQVCASLAPLINQLDLIWFLFCCFWFLFLVFFFGIFTPVQNIEGIPDNIKALYKTVWEISQRNIIKMAADRGAFIDQSQSLNIHIAEPSYGKLTSMHFYAWKLVNNSTALQSDHRFINFKI